MRIDICESVHTAMMALAKCKTASASDFAMLLSGAGSMPHQPPALYLQPPMLSKIMSGNSVKKHEQSQKTSITTGSEGHKGVGPKTSYNYSASKCLA